MAVVGTAVFGILGVVFYVVAWAVAGALIPAYDPLNQAISETFAIGAPTGPATLVRASLVVSGIALIAFAWALDRGLPGEGRAGPGVCAASGVLTMLVVAVPCTEGCPGGAASLTDVLHPIVAGGGYLALMLTPLLIAVRVRHHARTFARWSVVIGGVALLGLVVRNAGFDVLPGLQQRVFNTVADLWFVVAGAHLIRRVRADAL